MGAPGQKLDNPAEDAPPHHHPHHNERLTTGLEPELCPRNLPGPWEKLSIKDWQVGQKENQGLVPEDKFSVLRRHECYSISAEEEDLIIWQTGDTK